MRALGLDYGEKRTGVAISYSGTTATPLTVLQSAPRARVIGEVIALASENDVDVIVVGVPYTLSGEKSNQTKEALQFVKELAASSKIEIETIDERLTTKMAKFFLREAGSAKRTNRDVDKYAAAVILQTYLEKGIVGKKV